MSTTRKRVLTPN